MPEARFIESGYGRNFMASVPAVRFRDIWRLAVGAIITDIVTFLAFQNFGASSFETVIGVVSTGSLWWIVGYQRLSASRGWDSLQVRFGPIDGRILLAGALGGVVFTLLPVGLAAILELMGVTVSVPPTPSMMPLNLRQLPLAVVGVVALGPLSEELIFRGLLLDWLRQKMPDWPAAVIISLLFAFLHNPRFKDGVFGCITFLVRFSMSFGASYLAIRFRTLRASFMMHATMNGCVCLIGVSHGGG